MSAKHTLLIILLPIVGAVIGVFVVRLLGIQANIAGPVGGVVGVGVGRSASRAKKS